nr:unnamed protein product [Digitaria exilis]
MLTRGIGETAASGVKASRGPRPEQRWQQADDGLAQESRLLGATGHGRGAGSPVLLSGGGWQRRGEEGGSRISTN